jgi:glycosyltransferase involved in cell wall biosynthesis
MPHIVQISFFLDPQKRDPESLLRDWKTLRNVAHAASDADTRVTVIQASHAKALISDRGIDFYFQPFGPAAPRQHRLELFRLAGSLEADMFHVHGLGFPRETEQLATACPKPPILAQDHADRPPVFLRRMQFRRGYASLRGVTFTGLAKAQPYVEQKLFPPGIRMFDIPESSSHFSPGDQDEARRNSGLSGSPCVVWVGHLNANKDPLSVIDGVERAMQWLPDLHLWLVFRTSPLLNKVQERIRRSPALAGHIHLLGPVAHERLELLLRAADLFVVGSHSEGSGYALLEALSCGVPPVVTDIPSFRTLTADGKIGRLWPCGEPQQLANALRSIWSEPQQPLRDAVRSLFIRQLSFPALGAALRSAYREILAAP